MSEQSTSVFNPLSWTLIFLLVGLYALYTWYHGNLKADLTSTEVELAETAQLLTDSGARLDTSEKTVQALQTEISELTGQYRQQEQALRGELDAANQGIQGLKADIEALRVEDAEILKAEAQKASQAYAELRGRFDAANQQIAALDGDIERLNQDMADAVATAKAEAEQAAAAHQSQMEEAAAAHQAETEQLEEQMTGRITFFQTALEGSDPERAAQMSSVDEQLRSNEQAIEQLEQGVQQLEAAKADLEVQLSDAKQAIQDREQVLSEAAREHQALLGELSERKSDLAALETKYDQTVAQATVDLAVIEAKLEAERKDHGETRSAHAQTLAEMEQEAANTLAEARAAAAAALEAANAEAAASIDQAKAEAAATLQAAKDEASAAMQAAADSAAAALEEAKMAHGTAIAEADGKIASLSEELAGEQAALSALQQKHDSMVAELNEKLAGTEQSLAGVEADLSAANQQAADAKAAYEKQIGELETDIGERKTQIADLEQTLEQARADAVEMRAASAKALADQRALYQQYAELGGRNTERGMLLSLADTEVMFGVNQSDLPEELPSVDKIAALLGEHPDLRARVEGHTDSGGKDETNLELSQKRAEAVKQALIDRGVAADRLVAEGIGEARPIADNNSQAGRRQNRRVEIYVVEQ